MKAPVRKIIGQSTVDGPGNRTAVFLQGCNIRCVYCHNPETQAMHDPEAREMTVEEVMQEVEKGIPFIRGISVSGGECMLHQAFVLELFRAVHERYPKLTCLIDTNGTLPFYQLDKPLMLTELGNETDGVMLDVKAWYDNVWHSVTGHSSNAVVKQNLRTLLLAGKITEVRIVCLPEQGPIQTDVEQIIAGIRSVAEDCGRPMPKVHLITFRPHGVEGPMAEAPMTPVEEMERYNRLLS